MRYRRSGGGLERPTRFLRYKRNLRNSNSVRWPAQGNPLWYLPIQIAPIQSSFSRFFKKLCRPRESKLLVLLATSLSAAQSQNACFHVSKWILETGMPGLDPSVCGFGMYFRVVLRAEEAKLLPISSCRK